MYSILVVEDSMFTRRQIVKMLSRVDCTIIEAVNGQEGLEKVRQHHPDCIILDLLMPEMDGMDVLRNLQQEETDIPVIVLSADVQETTRIECLALGAVTFLDKPVQGPRLLEAVHNIFCTL